MTDQSRAQPQTATSTTTGIFALLTAKPGVTRERVMAIMPAEIRATVQLYLEGKIREWYAREDGRGAISGIFTAASAVGAYLSIHYFYVPPFLFFLVIAALMATAAVQLLRRPERTIGSSQCLT